MLEIRNLKIRYRTREGYIQAVDDVSLTVKKGENVGLVGESGCGKTTLARSILRILPPNGEINGGKIIFEGRDLTKVGEEEMNKIRWAKISLIPQSAMNSLDPVYKVGDQIVEAIRAHENISRREAMNRVEELFDLVGLNRNRIHDYPHQLSGGMRQRVMIAMALALNPELIIADEATTALDVIVQDQILRRIKLLQDKLHNSMLIITHNIAVVAETCQKTAVMYAGKILEVADTRTIFKNPFHPYTIGLLNAFPSIRSERKTLIYLPGSPPDLRKPPKGCRFHERCPLATRICTSLQPMKTEIESGHIVYCHHIDKIEKFRELAKMPKTWMKISVARRT